MKRRTVLFGLGTAAAGSAAAFGSGAFTSLRAERQVNIAVSNDSDASLIIEANNTSIPGGSSSGSSLGTTSIDQLVTSNSGNQELDGLPGPSVSATPLSQYAGQVTRSNAADLVTENGGQITLNLDEAEFAPGWNQGVVFFEDLIRIQNQTINDLELSSTKSGAGAADFDLLFFEITPGNASTGRVNSVFNTTSQFRGSNIGGLTPVIDSADATLSGPVNIELSVDVL
jgi:hypothetical protein